MIIGGKNFSGPIPLSSNEIPSIRAVYCILINEEIVYIGRSINLSNRIKNIRSANVYKNSSAQIYYWTSKDYSELVNLEMELISSLDPKFNYDSSFRQAMQSENAQKASKYSALLAFLASSIAIAIAVSSLFGYFGDGRKETTRSFEKEIQELQDLSNIHASAVDHLKEVVAPLQEAIKNGLDPESSAGQQELARLSKELKSVTERINSLEAALNTDPAKSLAVPILRKDLDNTRDSLKANIDQTKAEIDRIYDQNKWFIGLMISIALSVVGMSASSYFSKRTADAASE